MEVRLNRKAYKFSVMDVLQYLTIGFRVKNIIMEVFFLNYKDEVKKLISETYESADYFNREFEFTTEDLTDNLLRILPYKSIDEHLVYESLLELNFKPIENPKKPMVFSWYFKRK